MDERLESLQAELRAIERWDGIHFRKKSRDQFDEMSYRARRDRYDEITREILELSDQLTGTQLIGADGLPRIK